MDCPICKKAMKSGFVRSLARGGICWVDDRVEWREPRSNAGFIQIGESPWLKSSCVPAEQCPSCKIILIDYSDVK